MSRKLIPNVLFLLAAICTVSSSQTLDSRIEGHVTDLNGAVVANAAITASNLGTGESRTTVTNEEGSFRFPIIVPGQYTITVEATGFKGLRQGISLSAGESTNVALTVEPGLPDEIVVVTSDAAITDTSRIAVGRQVNERDVNNLPLLARNPYNFVLLQPGVAGRGMPNPNAIDVSVAGLRRRVGYQIDGNAENDFGLSGFRLSLPSEVFVREIQILSTGYPAEFGNTAGAIVNVVTPSGSNELTGMASAIYRPSTLTAKPFSFVPGTSSNVNAYGGTATLAGPIVRNRWHFYAGYEWTERHSIAPITITPSERDLLINAGLSPGSFVNTNSQSDTLPYFIARTDAKLSDSTRMNARFNLFVAHLRHAGPGGRLTTEREYGYSGFAYALSLQTVTTFTPKFFSEFRFQPARHVTRTIAGRSTPTGPTITITGIASFGPDPNVGTVGPDEATTQFQESLTRLVGRHTFKFGGGVIFIVDRPTGPLSSQYTFRSISDYVKALTGAIPRGYSKYQENAGDNKIPDNAIFYNGFVQDEWSISRRVKLSLGLRYEFFDNPDGDPSASLDISKKFKSDGNNVAPRVGFTYLLHNGRYRTLIRFGGGMHYDPPILNMYRRALLNNGGTSYATFSFPGRANGPDFPNRVNSGQPSDVDAVAPDFVTMYAIRSSIQVEQAISNDVSITLGYINSIARHIPVYRNINCLPTGRTLADGRPIYGTTSEPDAAGNINVTPCVNKVYSQYNLIKIAESVGNQNYQGAFVQFLKRFSGGFQMNANYTLSRSRDDAPEENGPASLTVSDPSNRHIEGSRSRNDVTQVFNMSLVARPTVRVGRGFLNTVLNGNQLSMIMIADSGETFNITTGDINGDGVTGPAGPDRPVGVSRNAGRLPAFLGVDARYSRFIALGEKRSVEFYVEATNDFNRKQVSSYDATNLSSNSTTSIVDPITGMLRGSLPDPSTMLPSWRESRQVQVGVKVHF